MAEPLLRCPPNWISGCLEPDHKLGLIDSVGTGSTPPTSDSSFWDGGIPWLTPKELEVGSTALYVSSTVRTISDAAISKTSAKILPANTVMLSKRAPVGAVAINTVPMATNQGFLNFRCGPNLRPIYLALWLVVNKRYLDKVANGSTYPELYKSDLFELEISAPSLDQQDRIIAVVRALNFVVELGGPLQHAAPDPSKALLFGRETSGLEATSRQLLPLLLSGAFDLSKGSFDV